MNKGKEISPHSLEIYISYHHLTASSLGESIRALGLIADDSAELYANKVSIGKENLPTLEIDAVHTGDSIKFTFGEGWLPSISSDKENDIIINTPKKLGIPLLVGFLLLTGLKNSLTIYNEYLDTRIKKIELVLKQSEVQKIRENREEWNTLVNKSIKIVNTILINHEYTKFIVYDVDIINIKNENKHPDYHKNDQ